MAVIGIDMGGTRIKAGLISKGKIVKKVEVGTQARNSKKVVLNNIIKTVKKVYRKDVEGIGIGVPGSTNGKVVFRLANVPKFINVQLKKILENKFKVKVKINNDSNCFALAESEYGQGKKYRNIVGLIIGTGVGSGIIINKQLYNGKDFLAGEFGQIRVGNKRLEDFCAGKFIKERAEFYGIKKKPEELEKLAKKNRKARLVFEQAGINIGYLVSIVISSLNPDIIILGGGISKSFKLFEKSMKKSVKYDVFYEKARKTKIAASKLKDAGILGAGALISNQ